MMTDNRLQLVRVNTFYLSDNPYLDLLMFIFRDYLIRRRVMLLVRHQNMRDQGALTWQK